MTETINSEAKRNYHRFILRRIVFILVLLVTVIVCMGVSLSLGPRDLSFSDVYRILFDHITGTKYTPGSSAYWDDFVVCSERLPRIVVAVIAGIGLSVCGTVIQGMVKNPLADPYTTGISSGAVFGVTVAMALGFAAGSTSSGFGTILNAFIFGMIPAVVIILISRMRNSSPATIILAGIAMSFMFSAMSTLLMLVSDAETISNIYKWQVGSFENTTWNTVPIMGAMVATGTVLCILLSNKLNVLALGDESAKSLGLDADSLRMVCLIIISLMTASVCGFVGIIGFVGLVAPNAARIVMGSDNKYLIPSAMLCGGAILLLADTIARNITSVSVPVGVIMSFIGGPLFMAILILNKKGVW